MAWWPGRSRGRWSGRLMRACWSPGPASSRSRRAGGCGRGRSPAQAPQRPPTTMPPVQPASHHATALTAGWGHRAGGAARCRPLAPGACRTPGTRPGSAVRAVSRDGLAAVGASSAKVIVRLLLLRDALSGGRAQPVEPVAPPLVTVIERFHTPFVMCCALPVSSFTACSTARTAFSFVLTQTDGCTGRARELAPYRSVGGR